MQKAEIYPIRMVDPNSDYSLLTVGDVTSNQKNILLQRIQILQLENIQLRKRQEYLKMINTTLLEALGNKDTLKQMVDKFAQQEGWRSQQAEGGHTNKMNSFKKKTKQRKIDFEEDHKRSIQTIFQSGDLDANSTYKKVDPFNQDQFSLSKQKLFSKTKAPSFYDKKQFQEVFKNRSATPKVHACSNNAQMRKSTKSFMQPLQLQNSFSKKDIYVPVSVKSQKSQVSNSSKVVRNIATALLCDLCGLSYSPLQFMSHARQCQYNHYQQQNQNQNQLIKITDKSFQQDDSDQQDQQLLQTLQQQKYALLNQINLLKRNRNSPDKRLQRNLDQIVFIINNKKSMNQRDIKTLLQQKNCYTTSTARKR